MWARSALNRRSYLRVALSVALATVWSIGPVAACELVVRQTPFSVVLNYDVFGFQAAVVSAELILSNQSGTAEDMVQGRKFREAAAGVRALNPDTVDDREDCDSNVESVPLPDDCEQIVPDAPVRDPMVPDNPASLEPLEIEIPGSECLLKLAIADRAGAPPPFNLQNSNASYTILFPDLINSSSDVPDDGIYRLVLQPGQTRRIPIDIIMDQAQIVEAGNYMEEYRIRILDLDEQQLSDDILGRFTVDSVPRAQINIAGSEGDFADNRFTDTIFFEEPELGDRRRVFVQTRANSTSRLSITSTHGAKMVHESVPGSYISYEIRLDGEKVDLTDVMEFPTSLNINGASTAMDLVISELIQPFSGTYQDLLTLSITTD